MRALIIFMFSFNVSNRRVETSLKNNHASSRRDSPERRAVRSLTQN
jgi:hypothetical protein